MLTEILDGHLHSSRWADSLTLEMRKHGVEYNLVVALKENGRFVEIYGGEFSWANDKYANLKDEVVEVLIDEANTVTFINCTSDTWRLK